MTQANSKPHAVVIGGGATGCGVARDLTLRGFIVTLVEFGDLGSGTSSRFHGMLQSGARYAVSDTDYGAECMRERLIVADLAPEVVEQTGGLFVSLPDDPPEFADKFLEGCQNARIPVQEMDPDQVMAEEPAISRNVLRAFSVPDATVQSWRLVNLLADDVRRMGGTILTRHQVTAIDTSGGNVRSVHVVGEGGEQTIEADIVVNAAGPWSARVAELVGESADLELGKGSIIVFSHRIVSRAVNRCRPPTSHDIIVPTGTVSLFGTTSEVVDNPDTTHVRPEEIQELLDNAETLIPKARSYRAFRAWAGVRPLFRPKDWPSDKPLPRRHSIVNHGDNGIAGFFTICGGSLTTHRSMAEDLGNHICKSLGMEAPCITATTPLSGRVDQSDWQPEGNYRQIEKSRQYLAPVCECESVNQADVLDQIENRDINHLHDLRRRLRIGFGPCQGTFCGSRVAALIARHHPEYSSNDDLGKFWTERLKGSTRTAWGQQARQALLSDVVYRETLGVRLTQNILPTDDRR
ncbi:MAG: FAD-dependent oxidoreductase [Rhodospirillales bacterium]|nr:FAD-dependent oxidoreductase [Rhodospirillales bacterium]